MGLVKSSNLISYTSCHKKLLFNQSNYESPSGKLRLYSTKLSSCGVAFYIFLCKVYRNYVAFKINKKWRGVSNIESKTWKTFQPCQSWLPSACRGGSRRRTTPSQSSCRGPWTTSSTAPPSDHRTPLVLRVSANAGPNSSELPLTCLVDLKLELKRCSPNK